MGVTSALENGDSPLAASPPPQPVLLPGPERLSWACVLGRPLPAHQGPGPPLEDPRSRGSPFPQVSPNPDLQGSACCKGSCFARVPRPIQDLPSRQETLLFASATKASSMGHCPFPVPLLCPVTLVQILASQTALGEPRCSHGLDGRQLWAGEADVKPQLRPRLLGAPNSHQTHNLHPEVLNQHLRQMDTHHFSGRRMPGSPEASRSPARVGWCRWAELPEFGTLRYCGGVDVETVLGPAGPERKRQLLPCLRPERQAPQS